MTPSPPTKIHEIFSSIQGEGPWSGRPCVFIRLFGCNSNCKGCDTPQASPRLMQPAEILDAVPDHPLPIVITGGEPCLQAEQLRMIAVMLPIGGMRPLALETNGTIPLDPDLVERFDLIVVGLKKNCIVDLDQWRYENVVLKLVVGDADWAWSPAQIWDFCSSFPEWRQKVWLMPEGATPAKLEQFGRKAWNLAIKLGVNYSDRLHIRSGGR